MKLAVAVLVLLIGTATCVPSEFFSKEDGELVARSLLQLQDADGLFESSLAGTDYAVKALALLKVLARGGVWLARGAHQRCDARSVRRPRCRTRSKPALASPSSPRES